MHYLLVIVLLAQWSVVQSQNWIGVYTLESLCEQATCCCPSNSFTMTRPSQNVLGYSLSLAGQCGGLTSYSGQGSYPANYSFRAPINVTSLTITLSDDSNALTIDSALGELCGDMANRADSSGSTTTMMPGMTTTTQ